MWLSITEPTILHWLSCARCGQIMSWHSSGQNSLIFFQTSTVCALVTALEVVWFQVARSFHVLYYTSLISLPGLLILSFTVTYPGFQLKSGDGVTWYFSKLSALMVGQKSLSSCTRVLGPCHPDCQQAEHTRTMVPNPYSSVFLFQQSKIPVGSECPTMRNERICSGQKWECDGFALTRNESVMDLFWPDT